MEYYVKSVISIIESNYHKLTSAEKTVADFFIHNNQNTDFSSSHIAELLYTSKATLSRFAKKIGYRGYQEFMRYKGDKELMLSDNMQNSIERWKRAYGQVTEKEIKKLEMEKALKKLLEDFFYVWNFRVLDTAFVREFLKHKNDDRYKRAMIVLIELMDKETKYFPELTKREANIWLIREIRDADEMIEINAYLGMLRNHLRRKEILGF